MYVTGEYLYNKAPLWADKILTQKKSILSNWKKTGHEGMLEYLHLVRVLALLMMKSWYQLHLFQGGTEQQMVGTAIAITAHQRAHTH